MFRKLSDYISLNYISRYYVLAIDVVATTVATNILYWSFSSILGNQVETLAYLWLSLATIVISVIAFMLFKTHHGILRHTTMREMWRVSGASILKSILLYLVIIISLKGSFQLDNIKVFIFQVADIVITLFTLIMIRVVLTNFYNLLVTRTARNGAKRIMIYGNDDDAVSVLGLIDKTQEMHYKCMGFVMFDESKDKKLLCGFPVFGVENERAFNKLMNAYSVEALIFPNRRSARIEKDRMVEYCARKKMEVLIKPTISGISDSYASQLREVKIEDLLGREQVEINMKEINNFLTDKVVMVSGAAGSIGSELCRLLLTIPIQKLIMLDIAETPMHNVQLELRDLAPKVEKKFIIADIRSRERVDAIFARYSPNVVFHAAAYKHVPLMESNPCEAVNVNVLGTKKLADLSVKYGVEKFVMISTDKAVNPANVMGASKRIAEIYVQSLSKAIASKKIAGRTKFITTRFGNVLGSNGSVIPLFRDQIASGGPITVTDPNIVRYFMTIPEACRLVMEAATMGKGNEIFVFDMGEPCKIVDLAEKMVTLAGLTPGHDIEIKYIGLRPGEKLYEELLNDNENTLPTIHNKIFLAKVRDYDYYEVEKDLEELKKDAYSMKKEDTVVTMKKIVPEYKSCNSRYEKFDGS